MFLLSCSVRRPVLLLLSRHRVAQTKERTVTMGRCNNRRAQERAAQDRATPSRARFSKGPPKKGGRSGGRNSNDDDSGRGGRDGGRGGRGRGGRNNDSVVQKIQHRVSQQRKDIGGISLVVKNKDTPASSSSVVRRRKKHPLDGVDVSKLDIITLSSESVTIVERLLRAYNVWEEDGEDEKKSEQLDDGDVEFAAAATSPSTTNDNDDEYFGIKKTAGEESNNIQVDTHKQQQFEEDDDAHSFSLLHGDESYDDYHGDYDDEPDFQNDADDIDNNTGKQYSMDVNIDDESAGSESDVDDDLQSNNDDDLMESPIFKNLTQHYSFQKADVILALKASNKRLLLSKKKNEPGDNVETNDDSDNAQDEGLLLEMAMDWLSLHLKESDLRRGFRVQILPKQPSSVSVFVQTNHPGMNQTIKAVPHESISIMPKLTASQLQKETKEKELEWKRQQLTTDLIRVGFHAKEVERVIVSVGKRLDIVLGRMSAQNEGSGDREEGLDLQPLSIMNGELFERLIDSVESKDGKSSSSLDPGVDEEMEEASILECEQEIEVLDAIYAEGFQMLSSTSDGSGGNSSSHHYRIAVSPTTPLTSPGRGDKCHLHVLTRRGYPLTSPPMLWFVNRTLPPTLLRRITCKVANKAKELMGQAAVFDLIEYLAENISMWQQEYTDEEAIVEENATKGKNVDTTNAEEDEGKIDFYTQTFTAEERKKLSRRQRQKLRAVEKSHARDEVLLEKKRQKELKDEERRARVRIENQTISSRTAEKIVERRWKEWVEEESEKAARNAMLAAFMRDESREQAREAAEAARIEVLRFHGELEVEPVSDEKQIDRNNVGALYAAPTQTSADTNGEVTGTEDDINKTEIDFVVAAKPTARQSGATPKTLLFTEKLRRMYEQKAKEKADGIRGGSSIEGSSEYSSIHLVSAGATPKEKSDGSDTPQTHVPAPVVAPSPGMEDVLRDVLETQKQQPWLIQSEARVPTKNDEKFHSIMTVKEARKKDEISNSLRVELEQKYSQASETSRGNRGRNSRCKNDRNRSKGSEFQLMLSQRIKLPAYKMKDKVLETIRANQVTVISGDTGCGKTTQVRRLQFAVLSLRKTRHI